jgi:hypothetical protein
MNMTTVVAVAGLVTTLLGSLAGPILQAQRVARYQDAAKLREMRVALYVEATTYVQSIEVSLDRIADPYPIRASQRVETSHRDHITPRLRLLAPSAVSVAWTNVLRCWDALDWEITEHHPEALGDGFGWSLSADDPHVAPVLEAVAKFHAATRAAVGIRE